MGVYMKKIIIIIFLFFIFGFVYFKFDDNKSIYMIDLSNKNIDEIRSYASSVNLNLIINDKCGDVSSGSFIDQSINVGEQIIDGSDLIVNISSGTCLDKYNEYNVNELGRVPIMMYHGIHNIDNDLTNYVGGNVDIDGYQRTVESFRNDLDFYYNSGYKMVRLIDYVNGVIDVPLGHSPIVITFDDGLKSNFNVIGVDSNGEIIIDPDCAVGILEEFKNKYPDFNVTATFFLNGGLFEQDEYNYKILKWLVDNGYDIGNHSYSHVDFSKISSSDTVNEIGSMYKLFSNVVGDRYVDIVALPFGSPYKKEHENFNFILNGNYDGFNYNTISTLRVGWESDYSPFSNKFDKTFIKRIRAYDNNGRDFDIEYNFNLLKENRYISDGDKNTIVFPEKLELDYNGFNLSYISY